MAAKKGKVTRVRRRERKNIERGQAHISSILTPPELNSSTFWWSTTVMWNWSNIFDHVNF